MATHFSAAGSGGSLCQTSRAEYPLIAAEKYAAALERVSSVHERFGRELSSIGEELGKQSALAGNAIASNGEVGPCLSSIEDSIRGISGAMKQAEEGIRSGREDLSSSVETVRRAIDQLKQRNEDMRRIIETGRKVTLSVNRIAEIAVENKLIAINAAVTASKASDTAKGFKVIANEISKLSGSMAERVERVVQSSGLVGTRMQQILSTMDASIESTQGTLGNIDEAYSLLSGIEGAIGGAKASNGRMLADTTSLAAINAALGEALESIGRSIEDTRRRTQTIEAIMERQRTGIRELGGIAGRLDSQARDMAAGRAGADGNSQEKGQPKLLRLAEVPLNQYDPALTRMIREIHFTGFTCIRLLRYSSDKKIVPYLADTWFLHPDGRTWEFSLKRGVLFHDGSPVRARDVRFSFERLMNPALSSPYAQLFSVIEGADDFIAGRARSVSGIRVLDDQRLQFVLKSSFNYFLSLLALGYSSIVKEDAEHFSKPFSRGQVISAGPFSFSADAEDGEARDTLLANPNFVNGRPFIDRVEIRRDIANQVEELVAGGLDVSYNITAAAMKSLRERGFTGTEHSYLSRYCYGLAVNFAKRGAFAAYPELRRALAMAVDKDALVRGELEGQALRADTLLSPELFDAGGAVWLPYDPAEAKRIVDSYRSRTDLAKTFRVAIRDYPAVPRLAEIEERLGSVFAELGLSVAFDRCPLAKPIDSYRDEYDFIFLGFLPELDLYSAVEPFINPNGGDNYFGYRNDELFALLEDSIAVQDLHERHERFLTIVERLTKDVFMVPLFFLKSVCAAADHVRSVIMNAEETVMAEVLYLAAEGEAAVSKAEYGTLVDALQTRTNALVGGFGELIGSSRNVGASLAEQDGLVSSSGELFKRFASSASSLQGSRQELAGTIRRTVDEAVRGSQAASIVRTGLEELLATLNGTLKALSQVRNDIKGMLEAIGSISVSNGFIKSIGVNAAIIAAKSDRAQGDLRKVSQSISEQAERNDEYTGGVLAILADMEEEAGGHAQFLGKIVAELLGSVQGIGRADQFIKAVVPRFDEAQQGSAAIDDASRTLASAVEKARAAVEDISGEAKLLGVHANTFKFGLDLEQAVADILEDTAQLNAGVRQYMGE